MKHKLRITIILISIFLITQLFGLYIMNKSYSKIDDKVVWENHAYNTQPSPEDDSIIFIFFFMILIGTLFFLFLFKKRKIKFLRGWFIFAIFFGISYSLYPIIKNNIIVFIISAILSILKVYKSNPIIHNLTEILVYSGIASVLVPAITLKGAFTILVLISLYDIYAVFHSKHMITLANSQNEMKIFSGLAIPYSQKNNKLKIHTKLSKPIKFDEKQDIDKNNSQSHSMAILGGGDIVFPLLFLGVILKNFTLNHSLIIALFTTVGLSLLFLFGKKGQMYPAMPYITLSSFIGFFVSILIF